jgi:hypothetical protein
MMWQIKLLSHILQQCTNSGYINSFPGTLPVSLSRKMLLRHLPYGYLVSLKADGERAFLFIVQDKQTIFHATLLHRDLQLQVLMQNYTDLEKHHTVTVFDVEVLQDCLLVFDTLVFASHSLVSDDYLFRIECAKRWTHEYRSESVVAISKAMLWTDPSLSAFTPASKFGTNCVVLSAKWHIFVKPVFYTHGLAKMWTYYSAVPSIQKEGLIFTRLLQSYTPFRSNVHSVLKWKVYDRISCDFKCVQTLCSPVLAESDVPDQYRPQQGNTYLMVVDDSKELVWCKANCALTDVIGEFVFRDSAWHMVKQRADKVHANSKETVENTVRNMQENITFQDLCASLV